MSIDSPRHAAEADTGHWWQTVQQAFILPLLALLLALVVGGIILAIAGYNPFHAYVLIWQGVFGSQRTFSEVLLKATPLIFTGAGIAIAFRCGVWNIGAEGQFYLGAIAATWVGVNGAGLPAMVLVPAVLGAGFAAGGAWALNEVVTTIMLNYIAIGLASYLVTGPMQESTHVFPQTDEIAAGARLLRIWLPTRLHLGFVIALGLALALTIVLFRTPLGYALRTVGLSPNTARYAGISVERNMVMAMLLSGGSAGLGGAVEIAGLTWRLFATISPGYGFDGIAVSLLASNNPLGTILSGLLFGALRASSELMQMNAQIPSVLTLIIQGLAIAFVVAFGVMGQRTALRRKAAPLTAEASQQP
jgi:simple sugar transport system permease protein